MRIQPHFSFSAALSTGFPQRGPTRGNRPYSKTRPIFGFQNLSPFPGVFFSHDRDAVAGGSRAYPDAVSFGRISPQAPLACRPPNASPRRATPGDTPSRSLISRSQSQMLTPTFHPRLTPANPTYPTWFTVSLKQNFILGAPISRRTGEITQ